MAEEVTNYTSLHIKNFKLKSSSSLVGMKGHSFGNETKVESECIVYGGVKGYLVNCVHAV